MHLICLTSASRPALTGTALLCTCCTLPLPPGLAFTSRYSYLHIFAMLPCILESFGLVQHVILLTLKPFFLFSLRKKLCSYKSFTKSQQHTGLNKVTVWEKKVKATDDCTESIGINLIIQYCYQIQFRLK